MKSVPIVCRRCFKTHEVSRTVANFWRDNSDIGYVCSPCMGARIHQAIIASDVAKFQAVTQAYRAITAPRL